jgi:uncharacterized protein
MPANSSSRWPRGLTEKRITVPANILQACEEFNSGRFFECHESLEEVWQEEQGPLRDAYKGLIQIAAAFVHITRDNHFGANKLLTTGLGYLQPYREPGALGMPLEEICLAAAVCLAEVTRLGKEQIGQFDIALAPRYSVDLERLASDARRWAAWGFDADGTAEEMTIFVPA